jgi:hypothetical protein
VVRRGSLVPISGARTAPRGVCRRGPYDNGIGRSEKDAASRRIHLHHRISSKDVSDESLDVVRAGRMHDHQPSQSLGQPVAGAVLGLREPAALGHLLRGYTADRERADRERLVAQRHPCGRRPSRPLRLADVYQRATRCGCRWIADKGWSATGTAATPAGGSRSTRPASLGPLTSPVGLRRRGPGRAAPAARSGGTPAARCRCPRSGSGRSPRSPSASCCSRCPPAGRRPGRRRAAARRR